MISRIFILTVVISTALTSCDDSRIYETNVKLSNQLWAHDSLLHFDFEIDDVKQSVNLLANIQYTNEFNFRNLYITHILYDSTNEIIDESLINIKLFSDKFGEPLGNSAVGDIYELQTPIISNYTFPNRGKYHMSFQQYMRIDSLYHLTSIGLRIEKSPINQ